MRFSGSSLALFALVGQAAAKGLLEGIINEWKNKIELYPLVGYASLNGGTTGGKGGKETVVSTEAELVAAIAGDAPKIVYINGVIQGQTATRYAVGPNTSIIGLGATSGVTGAGFNVRHVWNVIIRNLKISHVVGNDGITIQNSTQVWIDHNEFFSDNDHGFDYYDGNLDIIRASDFVTVSYNYFHDHWKNSLVGNSDILGAVDTGHLRITYHHNHWARLNTRTPALRFGHAHLFSNYYEDIYAQGIHTRSYGQVLVEHNSFRRAREALSTYGKVIAEDSPNTSPEGDYEPDGFANVRFNDWGNSPYNVTQVGNFTAVPYKYIPSPAGLVPLVVPLLAGVGKVWT